jgi:hypothetical protein
VIRAAPTPKPVRQVHLELADQLVSHAGSTPHGVAVALADDTNAHPDAPSPQGSIAAGVMAELDQQKKKRRKGREVAAVSSSLATGGGGGGGPVAASYDQGGPVAASYDQGGPMAAAPEAAPLESEGDGEAAAPADASKAMETTGPSRGAIMLRLALAFAALAAAVWLYRAWKNTRKGRRRK